MLLEVLLSRHNHIQHFFAIQQMVGILTACFNNDNVDRPIERAVFRGHVGRYRRAALDADVGRLVGRENRWNGPVDATLAHGFPIDEERYISTFGEAAAVVGELHPYLMLARRKHLRGSYDELLKPEEVVDVCELPVFDIEHPSTADPALRQNHSVGRLSFGSDDLSRN